MSYAAVLLFVLAAGGAIAANLYFLRAIAHRAPEAPESAARLLLWSHFAAGRENFTSQGWRYRMVAVRWAIAAAALVVLAWVVG